MQATIEDALSVLKVDGHVEVVLTMLHGEQDWSASRLGEAIRAGQSESRGCSKWNDKQWSDKYSA